MSSVRRAARGQRPSPGGLAARVLGGGIQRKDGSAQQGQFARRGFAGRGQQAVQAWQGAETQNGGGAN